MKTSPSGKSSGGGVMSAKTTHSPKASDASTKMKGGGSVNAEATRTGVANTPRTLGPREA